MEKKYVEVEVNDGRDTLSVTDVIAGQKLFIASEITGDWLKVNGLVPVESRLFKTLLTGAEVPPDDRAERLRIAEKILLQSFDLAEPVEEMKQTVDKVFELTKIFLAKSRSIDEAGK